MIPVTISANGIPVRPVTSGGSPAVKVASGGMPVNPASTGAPFTIDGYLPTPLISAAPAITGTANVGQVITLSNGTWIGGPLSYAYAWYRNGVALAGQTANTYTLVAGDKDKEITGGVVATNANGSSAQSRSAPVIPKT